MKTKVCLCLYGAFCLWLPVSGASADAAAAYPERPIRVVVPFPPGGGADVTMRILSDSLKSHLGQSLVIDNRGGASTIIGTDLVAKARPDGYTILLATTTFAINPSLHATLPYDPLKDLAPITLVAFTPYILVVHPSLPVKTVKDLIALAKERPGQLTYASVGNGSATHLATEMLVARTGIKVVHVPYKGSSPALSDLIGGHVSMYLGSMPASVPQARSGKLRALAVTGPRRAPAAPEVPTIAESGFPGYEFASWYGLFAPAGTPPAIIDQLRGAVRKVLEHPDMRNRMLAEGNEAVGNAPGEFAAIIRADIAKYAKIVKAANIKPD
ncbi:MAG TPA: tripartite tricarboxylate transporter substrate binding protein [Burkholderiales bacterium]|nr:tripartite tricarboxylate transporter substrate binding protein [Burkholderiales bacterium]